MLNSIEHALNEKYKLFFHPARLVKSLTPVCTLQRCVEVVNNELKYNSRSLLSWPAMKQDEAARLMRANWIYQRLAQEPIRKPVLCHFDNDKFIVDCGDTRLMALNLLPQPQVVSVVCVVDAADWHLFDQWMEIKTNSDLCAATKFSSQAQIALKLNDHNKIDWLEIGDHTTSHHLHSVDLRLHMMQNYLNSQVPDFEFDCAWATEPIDWNTYSK